MTRASGVEAKLRAYALGGLNDVLPGEFVVPHIVPTPLATCRQLLGSSWEPGWMGLCLLSLMNTGVTSGTACGAWFLCCSML